MFPKDIIKQFNLSQFHAERSEYIVCVNDRYAANHVHCCGSKDELIDLLYVLYDDKHYGDDFFVITPDGKVGKVRITGFDWR